MKNKKFFRLVISSGICLLIIISAYVISFRYPELKSDIGKIVAFIGIGWLLYFFKWLSSKGAEETFRENYTYVHEQSNSWSKKKIAIVIALIVAIGIILFILDCKYLNILSGGCSSYNEVQKLLIASSLFYICVVIVSIYVGIMSVIKK